MQGFWNQTWVFRGGTWLNVTGTSGRAPPAGETAMTYDSVLQEVLLVDSTYFPNATPALTWTFANGQWSYLATPTVAPYLGQAGSNLVYDASDEYALFAGPSTSEYTGNITEQTWVLNDTDLGAPPVLSFNVTPRNLTSGETVHISASATGGFGALALQVKIGIPGCPVSERGAGSWTCVVSGSGPAVILFQVFDQSGRAVSSIVSLYISAPSSPSYAWIEFAVAIGALLVAIAATVIFVHRRRRARSPPPNAPSAAETAVRPPP